MLGTTVRVYIANGRLEVIEEERGRERDRCNRYERSQKGRTMRGKVSENYNLTLLAANTAKVNKKRER